METNIIKQKIDQSGLVPVFFHSDAQTTISIIKACYKAGIRAFEFTNRGNEASAILNEIISHRADYPELAIGMGTIMDPKTCQHYIDQGVDFIVAPILDEETAKVCQQHNIAWTPGCGSVTEVIKASNLGAQLIKIFPGNVLGPDFIKAVKAIAPTLDLMPTGGVKPNHENLSQWFGSGVFCVGIGSQLFDKSKIAQEDWEGIQEDISSCIETIKLLKQKP